MSSAKMSVWQSPSGRLHWDHFCSGGSGHRSKRVSVSEEQFAEANKCRCISTVEFQEGRRAR